MTPQNKIILYPSAGSGLGQRELPKVHHLLKHHKGEYDLTYTEDVWHAVELATEAAGAGYKVAVTTEGVRRVVKSCSSKGQNCASKFTSKHLQPSVHLQES